MNPKPLAGPCLRLRLFGTPTCVHWSFVGVGLGVAAPVGLVSLFVASHLALALFAWSLLAVAVLVLAHELGHALAARLLSIEVHGLLFIGGGGCCLAGESQSRTGELFYSAAGLIVQSLLLGGTVVGVLPLGPAREGFFAQGAAVFAGVNFVLLVANAWPSTGSDGLRVARALRGLRRSVRQRLPNTSPERPSTGMAPRCAVVYAARRGARPVASAQLKR